MGADPSKLILGMPLYGHGFTLNDPSKHGFYDLAYQPIPAGPYTQQAGTWGYNEVFSCSQTPFMYSNTCA